MIQYTTGDILKSESSALVNTVNLEGYMGKGIAYQFKLEYPENNKAYIAACKTKEIAIGKVFTFKEKNKFVINFPTKDRWRANSKVEYIEFGLKSLIEEIKENSIRSISIPPLGCGNGGLVWSDIKPLIEDALKEIAESVEIYIYEPSAYFKSKAKVAPKINVSHIVLMTLKQKLKRFNKISLQKSGYFLNLFSGEAYFRFAEHKYGPYSHSIDILSTDIREFQEYYNIDTQRAIEVSYQSLVSQKINEKLDRFSEPISRTAEIVNAIDSDIFLEIIATYAWIIHGNPGINDNSLISEFRKWPKENQERYSDEILIQAIEKGIDVGLFSRGLLGIEIDPSINKPTLQK